MSNSKDHSLNISYFLIPFQKHPQAVQKPTGAESFARHGEPGCGHDKQWPGRGRATVQIFRKYINSPKPKNIDYYVIFERGK